MFLDLSLTVSDYIITLPCSLISKGYGRALYLETGQGEAVVLFGRLPRNSQKPWNATFLTLVVFLYFSFKFPHVISTDEQLKDDA